MHSALNIEFLLLLYFTTGLSVYSIEDDPPPLIRGMKTKLWLLDTNTLFQEEQLHFKFTNHSLAVISPKISVNKETLEMVSLLYFLFGAMFVYNCFSGYLNIKHVLRQVYFSQNFALRAEK